MIDFQNYINQTIDITLPGKVLLTGLLVEVGSDTLVIYDTVNYLYVPQHHIQHLTLSKDESYVLDNKQDSLVNDSSTLSFRKILNNAKGIFVEINVINGHSVHGYITNIMNNYFVFYSPVYKNMFIPFQHVKWLTPYKKNETPYELTAKDLPLQPDSHLSLARTFGEQLKRFVGKIVIFDLGLNTNAIGQLIDVNDTHALLTVERNDLSYLNLQHIKTLHLA